MKYDEATRTVTMSERDFLAFVCEQKRALLFSHAFQSLRDGKAINEEIESEIEAGYGHHVFIFEDLFDQFNDCGSKTRSRDIANFRIEWSQAATALARVVCDRLMREVNNA